jgi:plasmid stability protein
MSTTILQVRDLPKSVMAKLRERARAQGLSVSAYVRQLLADDVQQETTDEVISRIRTRAPVEISDEEIIAAIREERR